MAVANGISKVTKAATQTAKVGTKTGAVVGGVTVAAVGTGLGGLAAAKGNEIIDTVSDWSKYIPYIVAGIAGVILLILILRRK